MRFPLLVLALCGCTLTPIPDVSSEWLEPCDPSLRQCVVPFRLNATTETSVELRGDFRDGGWVQGEPMVKDGGVWEASITAGWGSPVQYKFFIDGNRWLLDPANPKSVPDGKGNTNSLLENISCAKWTCVPSTR
ncbi:MAG: hypothetical protein Q8L48_37290 [Archangium sp.]|nr:hypothetical protein [Archangium sp.]